MISSTHRIDDLISSTATQPRKPSPREAETALPIEWLGDPSREERKDEIVAGLFGAEEIVVLHADTKVGKTQIATDMSFKIATDQPWFGRRVKPGKVLYLAVEKGRVTRKRFRALQRLNRSTVPDIAISTSPISLQSEKDVNAIISTARTMTGVVLIVLDTLNRSMGGVDENSAGQVGAVFNALTKIASATGAAILVLHHNTKGGKIRGSSAIEASADVVISLDKFANGEREATIDLANDASEGQKFRFRMEVVEVWPQTETHAAENTIVIQAIGSSGAPEGALQRMKPADYERAKDIAALFREIAPEGSVCRSDLLNSARDRSLVSSNGASAGEQLRRALCAAKDLGLLDYNKTDVWLESSQSPMAQPHLRDGGCWPNSIGPIGAPIGGKLGSIGPVGVENDDNPNRKPNRLANAGQGGVA